MLMVKCITGWSQSQDIWDAHTTMCDKQAHTRWKKTYYLPTCMFWELPREHASEPDQYRTILSISFHGYTNGMYLIIGGDNHVDRKPTKVRS